MSDIFSHAPAARSEESGPQPPIELTISLEASPEQSFLGWVDHLHLWWPTAKFSVSGEEAFVDFEGDELIETSTDNQTISWGAVTSREPASYLSFSWHPGGNPLQATEVQLRFETLTDGDTQTPGTGMKLTHGGWEKLPNASAERAEYSQRWPAILERYTRFMGGPPRTAKLSGERGDAP